MKWLTTQTWLVFCLGFLLVLGQCSLYMAQAQPEAEEEEEEVQPRPNPMDKTFLKGRGSLSMQPGQSLQNKQGLSLPAVQKMNVGKGLTAGGTGIVSPGSSSATGTGQLPKGNPLEGMRNPMSGQSVKGMKAGKGLTAGGTGIASPGSSSASGSGQLPTGNPLEDMGSPNPMSGQSAVGMGTGGNGGPDNPIDPVTIGIKK